jgi:phage protein D
MHHDHMRIEIDGAEVPGLYDDLIALEVELDDELTAMARLTLALLLRPDGSWTYLDDDRLALWRRITVTAGLEDDTVPLLHGYITHLRPDLGAGPEQCVLEVWAMDAGVLMDRVDRLRSWTNKRDSDIATEIFQSYGLDPDVTNTRIVHDEEVSTIVQRETDLQLLRRLALRNGFDCHVDGDTGHFGPLALSDTPQPVLAVQFGDETSVDRLRLEVNALAVTDVAMHQLHHVTGDLLDAAATSPGEPLLGATPATGLVAPGMPSAQVVVAQTVATGAPEMAALCQGLRDRSAWFVTGEGEVAANDYGRVLRPRGTVTVKGVGETHSGVYLVTHVTHRFTAEGYRQLFKVKRNAVMPAGVEAFTSSNDLLGSLAGAP